ncbi:MAG: ABC transporter ATP-binding protein, partial [Clostridia bacterium]|nr:ABC transporter ATP-binding protein [Clostridia bacterium]
KKYEGKVCFDRVTLRYKGAAEPSLEDISFTAYPGETIGIIGGTGSGKTSLISLIGGFYTPESGTVAVDGRDVLSYDRKALLSGIALVPQKAVLFKGSIRDNLLWGRRDASDEELWDALRVAQAADFIEEKEGLDTPVSQNGRNFSGGQRQRLTVARALVKRAGILILDDSSSALDFATDSAMRRAIRDLDYSPTVFIVTQRTSSIMHADRIIVLDDGRICGTGRHEELLETCPEYREIHDSQFKKGGDE